MKGTELKLISELAIKKSNKEILDFTNHMKKDIICKKCNTTNYYSMRTYLEHRYIVCDNCENRINIWNIQ